MNENYSESQDEINPMLYNFNSDENELCEKLKKGFSSVIRIVPHPGMIYPQLPESVKYILHESYHSGTIDTASPRAKEFYNTAKSSGVKIFLTGVEKRIAYESVKGLDEMGIIPIFDISPIGALAKLQLISAFERNAKTELSSRLSNDV
jgi:L-asparaginase